MIKHAIRLFGILFVAMILFACSGEKKLEIEVNATLDGKPASSAKVIVDGIDAGATDDKGHFSKVFEKKPGREVQISVTKEAPGYRIETWMDSFVMKLPQQNIVDKYSFETELKATRFITLAVAEKEKPLANIAIKIGNKEVGRTDSEGELLYEYTAIPKKGITISASKKGYTTWKKRVIPHPGERIEISLSQQAVITFSAHTDEYGETKGIPDIRVMMNGKQIGKTNTDGSYTYRYKGDPGKIVKFSLIASGYIPGEWQTTVALQGRRTIERFFYPVKAKAIRVGVYGYANNTPGEDLREILQRIDEAVSNNFLSYSCFSELPENTLKEEIKQRKLNIEEITTKGWQQTALRKIVDMIILGSVTKEEKGMIIETKVYTSGGKLILSQINSAKVKSDVKGVAKDIVKNIVARFPFEGAIIAQKDDLYQINIGKNYKISRRTAFTLMGSKKDKSGRVARFYEIGTLEVKKSDKAISWAEVADIKKGEKINVGDKVIRLVYREEEKNASQKPVVISVKGGLESDIASLSGVNIYLNEKWAGTTGDNGKAEVPVLPKKRYDIVLYRHGYKEVHDRIRIEKENEVKEFVLAVNNALFKIESEPSGADVFIDGARIGRTPILDGKQVNFGFHSVKLSVGGNYRDWEEIVEFNEKEADHTGRNKIVLFKDYMKIGQEAEQSGNIDAAIESYASAEKDHPDYSAMRQRLARLYMDAKNDYDSAIREFENVLSLPENQQLIYKQFAVTYTNLGHAYYKKGDQLVQENSQTAAQNVAKAIENLQIAKQNMRFFPNQYYDEAVHDTYYFLALSYHKLYLISKKDSLLDKANLAWREYFDFFPRRLESNVTFAQIRESAEKYRAQINDLM